MNVKSKKTINEEILKAFYLLFDLDYTTSVDLVNYIKPHEIKNAYRKKALETHPDRARFYSLNELEMSERFKEINLAYEKLSDYSKNGSTLFHPADKHRSHDSSKPRSASSSGKSNYKCNSSSSKDNYTRENIHKDDRYYNGSMPSMELMIGQFLYYSGIISWRTLINSIVWQRRQRPLFGEIAREWNILSEDDLYNILNRIKFNDKIGEFALRYGYINQFEYMAIIGKQRYYKLPIGKYFLSKGIISEKNLENHLKEQHVHNKRIKSINDFHC